MGKRQSHEEHGGNHERWLLTYADLITLLMIFFVVLYSMSVMDNTKFLNVANALGIVLGDGPSIVNANMGFNGVIEGGGLGSQTQGELDATEEAVASVVADANVGDKAVVYMDDRGIVISFNDVMLFNSGSAQVNDSAKKVLKNIAKRIDILPNFVVVEGFTDNVPTGSSVYPTNWELSGARATNVARLMVSYGFNPNKISFKGYGEYRPGFPNDTAAHRAKNRRVDIIIMKTEHSKLEPHKATP